MTDSGAEDKRHFVPELLEGGDDPRTLRVIILSIHRRLQELEKRVEGTEHKQDSYKASIEHVYTHFDDRFEQVAVGMQELKTLVIRLNTVLREDDEALSLLARQRMTDMWIADHAKLHAAHKDWAVKLGTDWGPKLFWLALLGLIAAMVLGKGSVKGL